MPIRWTSELEIGINVIDSQHKRIVEYINKLEHAQVNLNRAEVGEVLDELVDYTLSHFAFEEGLMEEAGYPFLKPHKRVHALFTRRVSDYVQRFKMGENVTQELLHTLTAWLVNHIKNDDKDFAGSVQENIEAAERVMRRKRGMFSKLFGR